MDRRAPRSPNDKPLQVRRGPGRVHHMVVPLLICTLALLSMPLSVASAAPAVQSSSFAGNLPEDIPGSLTVPAPAGIANGDLLIFHAVAASDGLPITPPTGTTLINQSFAGDVLSAGVWYKIALNEPANYTFTTEPPQRMIAGVLRITGHKASGFIGANGVMFFSTGGLDTAIVTAPSIVESHTNFLVLRFAGVREEDPVDLTTPSEHIEVYNVQFAHNKLASARTTQASSGSVPSADFTTTPLFLHYVAHTVAIRGSDLATRVGLIGKNGEDEPSEPIPPGGGTARIPLGRVFFVEVADQTGAPAVSTFTLESPDVRPAITEARLFPDNVVIQFNRATPSARKLFQAVHLGTVTLKVFDAADPTSLRFSLPIEVTGPMKLGDTNNQVDGLPLDEILIDLGHRRGIPPHFIKGQIKREAAILPSGQFKPNSYRYEPLKVDLRYISDCVDPFISGNCHLRRIPPYSLYRLKTDDRLDRLDQGTGLDPSGADVSPREQLCIFKTDGTRRTMTEFDELITVEQIFDANDEIDPPDPAGCVSQNWLANLDNSVIRDKLMQDPNALNLTAQTTIASSFGLLQVLYSTAIAPIQWEGVNGKQNPSLLFDTPSNVASGGGSLVLGSGYLRRVFSRANPMVLVADPDFANQAALELTFRRAFNYYNGTRKKDALENGPYGIQALNFSREFLPIPSGSIFAGP